MRSYIFILIMILLICPSVLALEIAKQKWVARYNGPSNGDDYTHAIAVDSSGNVYVTGTSFDSNTSYDYTTIKYDPNGNQIWTARYNGPGNGSDEAYDLVIDNSGNVYVTGYSYGTDNINADYATVKYSSTGTQLWAARYNGPGDSDDGAVALAVDSSGNVYVTGYSFGTDGINSDYATIKYGTTGSQLWAKRYNGPGDNDDYAYDLAVDSSANIYVTVNSSGTDGINNDYATIKYNSNGTRLWVSRYDGPDNSEESAIALAVDNSGNVYVTGNSYISEIGNDYATVKYGPSGNQLWVARYNELRNGDDIATALAVDNPGNVYVTGYSDSNSTDTDYADYATIKYDPNGSQLWAAYYNGPSNDSDFATSLSIDNSGNAYITGYSSNGYNIDYTTVKYGPSGNLLWVKSYDGPVNGDDFALDSAVDSSDNVYVTGYSVGNDINYDYATIKYKQINCTSPIPGDLNNDCKVDLEDLAIMVSNWLDCNYLPQENCW